MGIAHLNQGEFHKAVQNFDTAIRQDPNNASAYRNRGVAYGSMDDFSRAIEDYVPGRPSR